MSLQNITILAVAKEIVILATNYTKCFGLMKRIYNKEIYKYMLLSQNTALYCLYPVLGILGHLYSRHGW